METALTSGGRGLPGGSSISRLLVERRTIRHRSDPPDLTIPQILAWAEAFLARTGQWPSARSGPILEAHGESWRMIERALRTGGRGLRAVCPSVVYATLRNTTNQPRPVEGGDDRTPQRA